MTVQSSTTLKSYFQTGDVPTEAQFADLVDSSPNSVDIAAATGSAFISNAISEAFTPSTQRVALIGSAGAMVAIPTDVMFMNSRRYERVFKLSDWSEGYSTNVPLLAVTSGDVDDIEPSEQVYSSGTYNSAPALYDAVTSLGAAYAMTGFDLVIPPGFWCLNSQPSGGSATITTGAVVSATAGSVVIQSAASASDHNYIGCIIEITSGTGSGQLRRINRYDGGDREVFNDDHDWTVTPGVGATYVIRRGYIIPLIPRMTIRSETGNWANTAIIRGASVNGDMFGSYQPASVNAAVDEIKDIQFRDITLDGGRVYAYQGGASDADAICPWDVIHWEKSLTYDDSRLRVLNCKTTGAIRHNIFIHSRGDIEIRGGRSAKSGDSCIKIVGATDLHITDIIISAAGRHALDLDDTNNAEIVAAQCYFTGLNGEARWDSSDPDECRFNGTAGKFDNCRHIRGHSNRWEDTVGGGILMSSCGDVHLLHNFFHNNGAIGSLAQGPAGTGIKYLGYSTITADIDGVDVITFYNPAHGLKYPTGGEITGWVAQTRDHQQIRNIVRVVPVNTRSKAFQDFKIDLKPGYLDTPAIPRSPTQTELWTIAGRTSFFDEEFFIESSNNPVDAFRTKFFYEDRPMIGWIDRVRNNRSEIHNSWDDETSFALSVAAVSTTASVAVWSQSNSVNRITFTVSDDRRSSINLKNAVEITGTPSGTLDGIYNVDNITATTIRVIAQNVTSGAADFTGGSATITGPVAQVILRDAIPGWIYQIGVSSIHGSAEPLVIVSEDENIATTISTVTTKRFAKYSSSGWYEVV